MQISESRAVAVTGGAGFIGSHLVERLLADGHSVTVVDSFVTGRRENLAHLSGHPRLTVAAADIVNDDLRPHFEGIAWVFHLAALADIVPSIRNPEAYFATNVQGTLRVLETARAAGVHRFVYASSSSCYGIPDLYPTPESAPMRPEYPYALTKLMGEELVLSWHHVYGLPAVSLRLFNVFGPRSRTSGTYGAVFGVFLAQKIAGHPLTIVGDGEQTRDFVFVTDVAAAFVEAAQSPIVGDAMNVGSSNSYSVNRLASLLGGETVYIPKRPGEPDCTQADISKIGRLLGWHPKVKFEDGVAIMLQNIESWRGAPIWTPKKIAEATADWFAYLAR